MKGCVPITTSTTVPSSQKPRRQRMQDNTLHPGDTEMQDTTKQIKNWADIFSTWFLLTSTSLHGLGAIVLLMLGTLQICWMTEKKDESELPNMSTFYNLSWIIIVSGAFLIIWTSVGWIIFIKRSIKLDITCGVSNFVLITLSYFVFCARTDKEELHAQTGICFVFILSIAILSSSLHSLFFFILKPNNIG